MSLETEALLDQVRRARERREVTTGHAFVSHPTRTDRCAHVIGREIEDFGRLSERTVREFLCWQDRGAHAR